MCTMPGVKEAIVVVGTDEEHEGYNKIYWFLIPNSEDDKELILSTMKLLVCIIVGSIEPVGTTAFAIMNLLISNAIIIAIINVIAYSLSFFIRN